ncbi:conserved oligomeric Golgi complex subunit 7 [Anopheles maculipalpis]|uniref:conserved oligomeric Golgi complex subunit 7 n=1 Tax=Anopheles maculipalpis TaxID=1496333 RepID=UPI0021599D90|nr:conserved oligomeric Golgi complex subunit 7 [Anopheles maculipalpis]
MYKYPSAVCDISAFSGDDFDVSSWINTSYERSQRTAATGSAGGKEAFVSSLVSKMQLYVQQINVALEQTGGQVLKNIPKVISDASMLQIESGLLKQRMNQVQREIAHLQTETGDCMVSLERLDNIKQRLQSSKQCLQEADGWGKLAGELEDLLEKSDIEASSGKLLSLQKSLAAQVALHGHAERENQVEYFKNRLEALVSPSVVVALRSMDTAACRRYVGIFEGIDRLAQLKQYYRTVLKAFVQERWAGAIEGSESGGSDVLKEFYDNLLEMLKNHLRWSCQCFGEATDCILAVAEALENLDPTRESIVRSALKRATDKFWTLTQFSKVNVSMGSLIEGLVRGGPQQDIRCDDETVIDRLASSLFVFFGVFLKEYPTLENTQLETALQSLTIVGSAPADSVHNLESANDKIIRWATEAMTRCQDITQNCALLSVGSVLQNYLLSYLDQYNKVQKQLAASQPNQTDWNLLQLSVVLLQYLGAFRQAVQELEQKLIENVQTKHTQLVTNPARARFEYRLNTKGEVNELRKMVTTFEASSEPNREFFTEFHTRMKRTCEDIHDTMLQIAFSPITKHFKQIEPVPSSPAGATIGSAAMDALPDYSYAPQEYITLISQYLLTLPQHLEPLLLSPASVLKAVLEVADHRYASNRPCADVFLALVVEESEALYVEQIENICSLNASGAKQLATDIEYFGSVLEEMGQSLGTNLQQTVKLLRAPLESYASTATGCDPELVAAIRQKRNLMSC